MSFAINSSHAFVNDTPVVIQVDDDQPTTSSNATSQEQPQTQSPSQTQEDSNVLSKGKPSSGGLVVQQVTDAVEDFY